MYYIKQKQFDALVLLQSKKQTHFFTHTQIFFYEINHSYAPTVATVYWVVAKWRRSGKILDKQNQEALIHQLLQLKERKWVQPPTLKALIC
ncbi:MAG: hypothetical protein IPP53_06870 [Bacteroidetes bacterium]|nr:hypothetical protein [Bacteroidota bacterium]